LRRHQSRRTARSARRSSMAGRVRATVTANPWKPGRCSSRTTTKFTSIGPSSNAIRHCSPAMPNQLRGHVSPSRCQASHQPRRKTAIWEGGPPAEGDAERGDGREQGVLPQVRQDGPGTEDAAPANSGRKPKRWANDLNTILAATPGDRFPIDVESLMRDYPKPRRRAPDLRTQTGNSKHNSGSGFRKVTDRDCAALYEEPTTQYCSIKDRCDSECARIYHFQPPAPGRAWLPAST
jgi:hypothetical protein